MIKEQAKKILKIFLGNILITVGYGFITIPNNIITGGVTGFSMIVGDAFSLNVGITTNIVTISLLILCLLFLGKEYFIHSLISSLFYMVLINVMLMLNVNINKGLFLNVVLSGLLVGLGYKYCIESKATTAGFDVVAIIINKYKNNFPVGSLIRYISIVIMVLGVYQFGWLSVVLGICMTFIQTQVLNKLLDHKVE